MSSFGYFKTDHASDFTANLKKPLEGVNYLSLIMSNIKNTYYNVNKTNNILYCSIYAYDEAAPAVGLVRNDFIVTVPPGNYSGSDLATKLETCIPQDLSNTFPLLPALTLDIQYDDNANTFSIHETSNNYKNTLRSGYYENLIIYDSFADSLSGWNHSSNPKNFKNTLNYVIGFNDLSSLALYPTGEVGVSSDPIDMTFVSSEYCKLLQDSYVYLCCDSVYNENVSNSDNNIVNQIISIIPVLSYDTSSIYEPTRPSKVQLQTSGSINKLRFFILDSNFQPATWLDDHDNNFTLEFSR